MKTTKHNISEKEYKNATFAIVISDASHYLILEDGRDFYLGEDWDSFEQTEKDFKTGEMAFKKEKALVTDTTGVQDEHKAYTISVKDADFGIDLDAFNNGKIDWI